MTTDDPTETDNAIIQSFQWIDERSPLPVDPTDYRQLKTVWSWARLERKRLGFERWIASLDDEEIDEDDMFAKHDARALTTFLNAVERRIIDMEVRDRNLLAAWNRGEPIR